MNATRHLYADPRTDPINAHIPLANRESTLLGVTITFLTAAILAVILRLWVRIRDRLWGWDDAFVTLACISSAAGDILVCLMPQDGLGLHLWTLSDSNLTVYFRHIYSTNIAYCTSAFLIKLAILFQFLRLFQECAQSRATFQYRLARGLTWALIGICSLWGIAFVSLAVFSCNPIAKNWRPELAGRCIGWGTKEPDIFFKMYVGHSVSNSALDVLVLLLPVPFFSMMRLAGKSRAGLITLYTLGCLVASNSVGRIIALSTNRLGTIPIPDMTFYTPLVYIFGVLEVNIAVIAASIPIFWPLLLTFASKEILVVNEIEIHVESRDSSISAMATDVSDGKNAFSGRNSRMTVTTKSLDRQRSRSSHRRKASEVSTLGKGFGHRPSQDSTRGLNRTKSNEHTRSNTSLSHEEEGWSDELDRIHSVQRTVVVKRSHIPLEQMKTYN